MIDWNGIWIVFVSAILVIAGLAVFFDWLDKKLGNKKTDRSPIGQVTDVIAFDDGSIEFKGILSEEAKDKYPNLWEHANPPLRPKARLAQWTAMEQGVKKDVEETLTLYPRRPHKHFFRFKTRSKKFVSTYPVYIFECEACGVRRAHRFGRYWNENEVAYLNNKQPPDRSWVTIEPVSEKLKRWRD